MERAERRVHGFKLAAHEPHLLKARGLKEAHHLLVLLTAHVAQLAHHAEDAHLVVGTHVAEVFERRLHACGVCVVGIDDEAVMGCHHQLRAVVARHIGGEGVAHLLLAHAKPQAYGCCSQHVVDVIRAYEVGVDGVHGAVEVTPLEVEERRTLCDLSVDVEVGRGIAAVAHELEVVGDAEQMVVVVVYEHHAVGTRAQEVV